MNLKHAITDVRGIEVGHAQDEEALTGCTVILCRKGAVAGVDVRGGAPGTRETDLLNPLNLVEKVHAVVLAGGSAFGLEAASGVMRYLEEQKIGFNSGAAKVPIVPSAILYDLNLGRADVRPDSAMGYRAAASASVEAPAQGNVGAGTGASVGKMFGAALAMKSGLGTASMDIGGGVVVGALVAVNAFGDVIDPGTNEIIAGLRSGKVGPLRVGGQESFCRYAGNDEEPRWTRHSRSRNTRQYCHWCGSDECTIDQSPGDQSRTDGAGWHCPHHQTGSYHAGWRYDLCLIHWQTEGRCFNVGAFAAEVMADAILQAVRMASPAGGLPGLNNS